MANEHEAKSEASPEESAFEQDFPWRWLFIPLPFYILVIRIAGSTGGYRDQIVNVIFTLFLFPLIHLVLLCAKHRHNWLFCIFAIVIVYPLFWAMIFMVFFGIQDSKRRQREEAQEKIVAEIRAETAIKQAECKTLADKLVVTNPIRDLSGPLELVIDENIMYQKEYEAFRIRSLLDSGVPGVRFQDADYTYETTGQGRMLVSVPAAGMPSAILHVSGYHPSSRDYERPSRPDASEYLMMTRINAKLVEFAASRTVFDQTWEHCFSPRAGSAEYWCPDYQPKKILTRALGLPEKLDELPMKKQEPIQVEGDIVGRINSGATGEMNPGKRFIERSHEMINTHCPDDVGWGTKKVIDRPFRLMGKTYFPGRRTYYNDYNAICDEESVFIYSRWREHSQKYHLTVEKRNLRDFRQVWERDIVISGVNVDHNNALKINAIESSVNDINLELVDENSGKIFLVQAPLRSKAFR